MFTAALGYESGRLAPRLIKTNPAKIDGKKQTKKPPRGETWRLIVKSGCLLRLRDHRSLTTIRSEALLIEPARSLSGFALPVL